MPEPPAFNDLRRQMRGGRTHFQIFDGEAWVEIAETQWLDRLQEQVEAMQQEAAAAKDRLQREMRDAKDQKSH